VTGRAAGLVLQRKIVANNAVFLLNGRAAGLLYGRPVAAAPAIIRADRTRCNDQSDPDLGVGDRARSSWWRATPP
jgi:hypothetical protein